MPLSPVPQVPNSSETESNKILSALIIKSPPLPIEKKWETYDLIIMGTGEPTDRIQKFISIKNKTKSIDKLVLQNQKHIGLELYIPYAIGLIISLLIIISSAIIILSLIHI